MSFHFGRKSCQALCYLHHNHKVGFNLYSGMLLSWPTGRPGGLSGHHFILKKVPWEAEIQPPPPATFFLRSVICFVLCVFIATSKQTPLFFLSSFILIF